LAIFSKLSDTSPYEISLDLHVRVNTTLHWVKTDMHARLDNTRSKGSDTLESFLSKVAFESNLRKKLSRIEHVLTMKVSFERRKIANVFMTRVQLFFRKSLSKATFERKLSSVSLA